MEGPRQAGVICVFRGNPLCGPTQLPLISVGPDGGFSGLRDGGLRPRVAARDGLIEDELPKHGLSLHAGRAPRGRQGRQRDRWLGRGRCGGWLRRLE